MYVLWPWGFLVWPFKIHLCGLLCIRALNGKIKWCQTSTFFLKWRIIKLSYFQNRKKPQLLCNYSICALQKLNVYTHRCSHTALRVSTIKFFTALTVCKGQTNTRQEMMYGCTMGSLTEMRSESDTNSWSLSDTNAFGFSLSLISHIENEIMGSDLHDD